MKATQLLLFTATLNANGNVRKMELLNHSLPACNPHAIADILKENGLPFPIPVVEWRGSYNCWGYVAFHYGWEEEAKWVRGCDMENHLAKNTKPISKEEVQFGDIAVFRRYNNLEHTALVTHEVDIICHKPGACDLCVDTMERACGMYGNNVTYVRPIKKS